MSILSKIIGAPDASTVIEKTGNALDKLFTSKDEKLSHAEIMEKIKQSPQEWQASANEISAGHRSVFVAGARPFILWVCGFGLANAFLVNPWIQWATGLPGPVLPLNDMSTLIWALLGLGGFRTVEKLNGAAK